MTDQPQLTPTDRMKIIARIQNGDHPCDVSNGPARIFMQAWMAAYRLTQIKRIRPNASAITLTYPDRLEVYDIKVSCDVPLLIVDRNEALMALAHAAGLSPVKAEDGAVDESAPQLGSLTTLRRYLDANPEQRLGQAVYNIARDASGLLTPQMSDVFNMTDVAFMESADRLSRGEARALLPDDDTTEDRLTALMSEIIELRKDRDRLIRERDAWSTMTEDGDSIMLGRPVVMPGGCHIRTLPTQPDPMAEDGWIDDPSANMGDYAIKEDDE